MKLETLIKPRADGTVRAELGSGEYIFKEDESGAMVCEVESPEHASHLLATGNFFPFDEDLEDLPPGGGEGGSDNLPPVPPVPTGAEPGTVPAGGEGEGGDNDPLAILVAELETMDKDALLAYAKENDIAGCGAHMKEATLRAKIIEHASAK